MHIPKAEFVAYTSDSQSHGAVTPVNTRTRASARAHTNKQTKTHITFTSTFQAFLDQAKLLLCTQTLDTTKHKQTPTSHA